MTRLEKLDAILDSTSQRVAFILPPIADFRLLGARGRLCQRGLFEQKYKGKFDEGEFDGTNILIKNKQQCESTRTDALWEVGRVMGRASLIQLDSCDIFTCSRWVVLVVEL